MTRCCSPCPHPHQEGQKEGLGLSRQGARGLDDPPDVCRAGLQGDERRHPDRRVHQLGFILRRQQASLHENLPQKVRVGGGGINGQNLGSFGRRVMRK